MHFLISEMTNVQNAIKSRKQFVLLGWEMMLNWSNINIYESNSVVIWPLFPDIVDFGISSEQLCEIKHAREL